MFTEDQKVLILTEKFNLCVFLFWFFPLNNSPLWGISELEQELTALLPGDNRYWFQGAVIPEGIHQLVAVNIDAADPETLGGDELGT